jgi:hypothetical protein
MVFGKLKIADCKNMHAKEELEAMNRNNGLTNQQTESVIIKTSMDFADGQLFQLEPDSLDVLRDIAKRFECGRMYKEKEVNQILEPIYDDYVTLRRYLIEHGFLGRNRDGSQYWLEEGKE